MVKIIRTFEYNKNITVGQSDSGRIFCKCNTCNKTMAFIKIEFKGNPTNVYLCQECKKTVKIPRHW